MKLEPLFIAKENKLYKIEDNSLFDVKNLKTYEVKWSELELAEESYNEELLANLREQAVFLCLDSFRFSHRTSLEALRSLKIFHTLSCFFDLL